MRGIFDRPSHWYALLFAGWGIGVLLAVSPEIWRSSHLLVQDDARHFVVWLRQLADQDLFAGDPIADYFRALTPGVYTALYAPASLLGIDPVTWHFLVVTPLACLLFTVAGFRFLSHLHLTVREAGLATLILCGVLSYAPMDGLPRSFGHAIVLFALVAFLERRILLVFATMAVGANLYPIACIVAGGAMAFFMLDGRSPFVSTDRKAWYAFCAAGVGAVGGLALFLISADDVGSVFTLAQARELPIFEEDGRLRFFRDSLLSQVLCSGDGGLLLVCIDTGTDAGPLLSLAVTVVVFAAAFVALRLNLRHTQAGREMAAASALAVRLAVALVLAGLVLYLASYLVAFRAHLPGRYATYSLGFAFQIAIVIAIMGGINLVARALASRVRIRTVQLAALCVIWPAVFADLAAEPVIYRDTEPQISAYLRSTPPDTLVAGFSGYIDSVPAFADRSVFFARELLITWTVRFYDQMEERIHALGTAYTAPLGPETADFLEQNGIDYLLVRRAGVEEPDRWIRSFPDLAALAQTNTFVDHSDLIRPCVAVRSGAYDLFDAHCLGSLLRQMGQADDRVSG